MSELTPYICVADSRAAITWYQDVLGAQVVFEPIVMPDGSVGHCELAVGGARWMMSDPSEPAGVAPPEPVSATSPSRNAVTLHLTVDDCDAVAARVQAAGVRLDRGPEESGPAGRVAVFHDPFGHRWFIATPPA